MTDRTLDAVFSLRGAGKSLVGRDRIDLLEALGEQGSISAAARVTGLSYKAAWDALNTINNLLPSPAFEAKTGGQRGGGAELTDHGRALILTFRLLEDRLKRAAQLMPDVGTGTLNPLDVLLGLGLRTSARNAFRCRVLSLSTGPVNSEVRLQLSRTATLVSTITSESVQTLSIRPDREILALVKASFITLHPPTSKDITGYENHITGIIVHRNDSPENSEFQIDINDGRILTAVISNTDSANLTLGPGDTTTATFKASHIILAAD